MRKNTITTAAMCGITLLCSTAINLNAADQTFTTPVASTPDGGSTGVRLGAMDNPLWVTGSNAGGRLMLGVPGDIRSGGPTAVFESSWGNASEPQCYMGLSRDGWKFGVAAKWSDGVHIFSNNIDAMRIDRDGNVGIGASTPSGKMDVSGSGFNGGRGIFRSSNSGNAVTIRGVDGPGINDVAYLDLDGSANGKRWVIGVSGSNASPAGDLRFCADDNGVYREVVHFSKNGNVGIGVSSPAVQLDIIGPLHVASISPIPNSQGCYVGWNRSGGIGETNFINHKGLGSGGFAWDNFDGTTFSRLMTIDGSGNVGIGGVPVTGKGKLQVYGTIQATEVRVNTAPWPDFVFDSTYRLLPLSEVAAYIQANKHLPGIPAASEVEKDGMGISDMVTKQMTKIEELTLYAIDLHKANERLSQDNHLLTQANNRLTQANDRLTQANVALTLRVEAIEKALGMAGR